MTSNDRNASPYRNASPHIAFPGLCIEVNEDKPNYQREKGL